MDSKLLLLCLAVLSLVLTASAKNPGVKMRITKKGVDFANKMAQAALDKALRTLKIPDQSGSEHHFEWSLKNIQNKGVNLPTSQISLDPAHNALAWSISNLGLSIKADWRVKYKKGWVKVSTSGSVDADAKGVSMSVSIALGMSKDGRPSISTASCSAHVGDVDLHFHGGTSFIINLFRHPLEDKVKDLLQGQICKIVTKQVNVDGEAKLAKVKVTVEMAHKFLLDYRLTATPVVSANYLESQHKGEVYWEKDVKEAPFAPKPIPALADVSKMLYIWLTEYTANTYAYAAQTHNFLVRNLTAQDLPAGNRSLLNTTCDKGMCIGKLIPQIGTQFPNCVVSVHAATTVAPSMSITPKAVTLMAKGNVDLYATCPSKTNTFLLTMNLTTSFTLGAKIENERLTGHIIDHKFEVGIVKSNVGKLQARALNIILGVAMNLKVIPELNELGKKGVDLPISGDIKFENTSLQFLNGSLLVSTDINALSETTKGTALKFRPEVHGA